MTDLFENLYEELLKGIEDIRKNNPDPKKQIEICFHLSETIGRKADAALAASGFQNEEEEILFFRTIKPRFTSMVEFYSILYRAELFVPENKVDQIEFWNHELQRAQIFLTRHASLMDYLKSTDTSNDKAYFLRLPLKNMSAAQDEQIAKLLAREQYIRYINKEILPGLALA